MKSMRLLAVLGVLLAAPIRAQTPCHAENDGPGFDDLTAMAGAWVAIKFVAPTTFDATRIEVFTGEALANNSVSLWTQDSSLDQPGTFLGLGAWTMTPTDSWQGGTLAFPVPLTAGTTYWFVWVPAATAQASIDNTAVGLGPIFKSSTTSGQTWNGPFQTTVHHWKFRIFGNCASAPLVFCTAGTSSSGCVAAISANGNPNVAHSAPCQIAIANVEGQRAGIVFYGLSAFPQPWCTMGGGTSFLCVKTPTSRANVQNTGGAAGQCNGALALDWNAFQLGHPGALGAPWIAGEKAYVQGWFRDPPACKTTSLSNALELTYSP